MIQWFQTASAPTRRTFLRFLVGGAAGSAFVPQALTSAETAAKPKRGKSCILLWMNGGPSQLETFDPKSGESTGGPTRSVETSVRGVKISAFLPRLAQQMEHLSLIRSLSTGEAAHERGRYLMHTGYSPIPGLSFAPLGTVASYELATVEFPLPTFVALSAPDIPHSDVFGETHLPFALRDVEDPVANIRSLESVKRKRRARLLQAQEEAFLSVRQGREVERRRAATRKAEDLMTTELLSAFRIEDEPEAVRERYGGEFGQQCLLARRLVTAGVPFVEIGLGGWDTHRDNFDKTRKLCTELDTGFASLLEDLAASGQLSETLILWAGEFGRTPTINGDDGRDHWARCWSVALAGGGIQGGRVIGATDKLGMDIASRPVAVEDFFATAYHALGIDPAEKYTVSGRKVKYAYGGKPVRELF